MYSLKAISPLDGRYSNKIFEHLSQYFSESALIKTRVEVEIKYLIELLHFLDNFDNSDITNLCDIYLNFQDTECLRIKEIEKETNHDVKAVEYYIRELIDKKYHPWIHFGLTSQDINQTALPIIMKRFNENKMIYYVGQTVQKLWKMGLNYDRVPMLSRTHGQPASPTTLGKEIIVFSERLRDQFHLLEDFVFSAKLGGAVGNFNAHYLAYPNKNWNEWADSFIEGEFGIKRTHYTTQIEPYDNLAEYFHIVMRINTILIDCVRDIWTYISLDYFKLAVVDGEIGSSTMPHKVNPIDFENAEGNLGIANALLSHFAQKLPVSRLQRDLTDSTVTRNIGVALGHGLLAYLSLLKGLDKLEVNYQKVSQDLNENWAVVTEGLQTILRREGQTDSYEQLKKLSRGNKITQDKISEWIEGLNVTDKLKKELSNVTPFNYLGILM